MNKLLFFLGTLPIVAALVFVGLAARYEIRAAHGGGLFHHDRLTGSVQFCSPPKDNDPLGFECKEIHSGSLYEETDTRHICGHRPGRAARPMAGGVSGTREIQNQETLRWCSLAFG